MTSYTRRTLTHDDDIFDYEPEYTTKLELTPLGKKTVAGIATVGAGVGAAAMAITAGPAFAVAGVATVVGISAAGFVKNLFKGWTE